MDEIVASEVTLWEKRRVRGEVLLVADIAKLGDYVLAVQLAEIQQRSSLGQNYFQDDMFIQVPCGGEPKEMTTTYRRCLFDTGAELNMISYSAWCGLDIDIESGDREVTGIGGFVNLPGFVILNWNFGVDRQKSRNKLQSFQSPFYVLPQEHGGCFDCIIGRPWIQENIHFFLEFLTEKAMRFAPSIQNSATYRNLMKPVCIAVSPQIVPAMGCPDALTNSQGI